MKHGPLRIGCVFAALGVLVLLGTRSAAAAGRVELLLVGRSQAGGEFHQWLQVLSRVGADRVALRGAQPTDKVGIEVQGPAERPTYVVTGIIDGQNELVLPGARFDRGQQAQIARWVADLAHNGPPQGRPQQSAFGLSAEQFQQVRDDLAPPVSLATAGLARDELVRQLAAKIEIPLSVDAATREALGGDKVGDEFEGLSRGTVLAAVLRPAGLGLVPEAGGGGLRYRVAPYAPGRDVWPIGWKSEKLDKDVLPGLLEFLTASIDHVPAQTAMEAIAKRLHVPLVVDHNALARQGIDPAKTLVSLPRRRSTHGLILDKVLFQARLKKELRVDEAGKPLLWITTLKTVY